MDNLKRIENASSYKNLLAVAVHVLCAMRNEHPLKPIAIICGPISTGGKGSRETNLKIFNRAIDKIVSDGLLVFSQMPFEDDMERIFKSNPELQGLRLLEEFYLPIFELSFIKLMCFLPGWRSSVGATWEHEQAKKLKIPIIYLYESYITD